MDITKTKFSIGDRVMTKKLGLPAIGTVFGVLDPETYLAAAILSGRDMSNTIWDNVCQDWKTQPVYYIKFSEPQRSLSFEEYKEYLEQKGFRHSNAEWKAYYLKECSPVLLTSHPEDDLDLFE